MKQRMFPASIILLILGVACRPVSGGRPPVAPSPTPVATPVTTPVTTTGAITPASDGTTTAPTVPAVAPSPVGEAGAPVFDVSPGDLGIFSTGLVAAEQATPGKLTGAPFYQIDIAIGEAMNTVTGRQVVTLTNTEDIALDEVYFHLHPRTLEGDMEVTDVVAGTGADAEAVEAVAEGDVLRVPLPAPLAPGESVTLSMNFETTVPTDIGRNYGVLAYYEDILALAHFYPMLAVYDDEGWNIAEPDVQGDLTYGDAALFVTRVTAPDDVILVASGAAVEQSAGDGTQTITYAVGPARDFFLAAGDFEVVSRTVGETTIHSYAPADRVDGAAAALDVAAVALADYSERLGPYPYTELDIVTTPTSALGIEYPGIIVGTLGMYDVEATTQGGIPLRAILESTTAHEVAHQWFYNLVGNDQLDEPWLDEAVVSYTTYRYFVERYGQRAADSYFETFFGRWERADMDEIPVGLPVADYDGAEYSAIVYGRGPIFLRELEETIGRETFDAFLSDYAGRFRWAIADAAAFRDLAEEHCACDLGPLFAEWVTG